MDDRELKIRFVYPAPTDRQQEKSAEITKRLGDVAEFLNANMPDGREKNLAVTHLEQALMWATAAVAREKKAE